MELIRKQIHSTIHHVDTRHCYQTCLPFTIELIRKQFNPLRPLLPYEYSILCPRVRGIAHYALYKSTYLLTYKTGLNCHL